MSVRFVKRGGAVFDTQTCDPNLNLLAHAQLIELDIGSRCGGHGHCGGDRVQVPEGAVVSPVSKEELEHLSSAEIAQGWRLACQCFPGKTKKALDVIF